MCAPVMLGPMQDSSAAD